MPKLIRKIPSYRLHRASGQAVVSFGGKDFYLGPHGSPESDDAYKRLVAQWAAGGQPERREPGSRRGEVSVDELIVAYWRFAEGYYVKNGEPTGEQHALRDAIKSLTKLFGKSRVSEFGPLALKAIRQSLIESGLCRNVINARVKRVRRIFKWGVENELVNPVILHGLQAIAPLKRGRCGVRESEPVRPVPDALVDAVLPHVPSAVKAMIQLQRLTGMRPSEVTSMRTCDLDTTGKIWSYIPESHKTEHHGRKRLIYLGPQAQALVKPLLKADLQAWIFNPREALNERHAACRTHRRHPKLERKTRRKVGSRYKTPSYGRAIAYGCEAAFPAPAELTIAPEGEAAQRNTARLEKLNQWHREHHWTPNQLRHNAATFLRKQYGLDAARVILGHSSPVVTEVYAELDQAKAQQIMAEVG